MSRPRKTFTDHLDDWLQDATAEEVEDALKSIRIWARWKKLPFSVEIKPIKTEGEEK